MKKHLTPAELKHRLKSENNLLLLDVRSEEEYLYKHIPQAEHMPLEQIESGKYIPASNKVLITICGKGGGRSERAAQYLSTKFSNEVYYLEGGTLGWMESETSP
ncbi:MAG: rhodanese-like domain-containing protein [Bacteroidia bacterium]|jgi:rhodanese-related sulfurtransferase|nr:rhodanese-like domain-containing protein [Bacteroidia bacterium]